MEQRQRRSGAKQWRGNLIGDLGGNATAHASGKDFWNKNPPDR
jgi:hypothetical protein